MKNWETKGFRSNFHYGMNCSLCPAKEFCKTCSSADDCVNIFFDYATKEYVKPVKKMTMQEWANITGMPVAKDMYGEVFIYHSVKINKLEESWNNECRSYMSITDRVSDVGKHDWTIPCYPEGDKNE
ncbi:MAG: hypothetical protein M0R51_10325 [Clostridia bacterium]|jgi:hypothetical protein|nr:hypothetical protein [Clostridia bacterium]